MPILFRHANEVEELGLAAYLRIEKYSSGYMGALFLINVLGEPQEFTYSRVETHHTFLWRPEDIRRHAARQLAASLFSLCPLTPRLLLCLATEADSDLFCRDIQLSIPVCRVAPQMQATARAAQESVEEAQADGPLHLFWFPDRPGEGSSQRKLVDQLISRRLLVEPFERAATGLREVYKQDGHG